MKPKHVFLLVLMISVMMPGDVCSDPMDELSDEFTTSYERLKPPPNSSVDSDYKLDQAALGTLYTNKSLQLIYKQNKEVSEKYNVLIEKYDRIIEQNNEIIKLLSIIAKQGPKNEFE